MEAIAIKNDFKILNHICLGIIMKDLTKNVNYSHFERIRYIRNSINYYGKKIGFTQGKFLLEKTLLLKHKLLNEELNEYLTT